MRATLIGCGSLGRQYAEAATGLATLNLHRFADVDAGRAQRLADDMGGTALDVAAALDSSTDEVLIVADVTAISALDGAGVTPAAWLLAPPLGTTVASVRATLSMMRASAAPVLVGFAMRFEPLVRLTRALLPNPKFLHGEALRPDVAPGESTEAPWWRLAPEALDLACHLMDGTPRTIHAEGGALLRPGSGVDSAVCTLTFAEGRAASMLVAVADRPAATGGLAIELTDGARRVALWDEAQAADLVGFERAEIERRLPDGVSCTWVSEGLCQARTTTAPLSALAAQLAAVADVARADTAPTHAAGLDEGVRASALVLSGLASLRRGEPSAMAHV